MLHNTHRYVTVRSDRRTMSEIQQSSCSLLQYLHQQIPGMMSVECHCRYHMVFTVVFKHIYVMFKIARRLPIVMFRHHVSWMW